MREILERMGMIRDPRNANYIKHKLSDILFIVMCGVLSWLDTLSKPAVYAHEKEEFFKKLLGIETIPSEATFGRILSMLDGKYIRKGAFGNRSRSIGKANLCISFWM